MKQQTFLEESSVGYIITEEHYLSENDNESGCPVSERFIPEDYRDAGNLHRILHISSVGSRVMSRRNIITEKGLVSAMGRVVNIVLNNGGNLYGIDILLMITKLDK